MTQENQLQKVGFGFISDSDESLKSKASGDFAKFGLNEGFITKFEYNPNAGSDGAESDAIDVSIMIGDRENRRRLYDVTRIYDKNGNAITDESSPEYIKKYNESLNQVKAVVYHIVKALGVTDAQIQNSLSSGVSCFADWAKIMTALPGVNIETRPIQVFMEYQWNISEGQDRTFLEIPKNMKGGRFLTKAISPVGEWVEQKEWTETIDGETKQVKGLRYVDNANNIHPFVRSSNYMESRKAIQQFEKSTDSHSIGDVNESVAAW